MQTGMSADKPVLACTKERTDYQHVADYICPDGSRPLQGDLTAGGKARVRTTKGSDGHIIDVYEVPCPSGATQVFVDAYHCAGGVEQVDMDNLSPEMLQRFATIFRWLETNHSTEISRSRRQSGVEWLDETKQVSVMVCVAVILDLGEAEDEFGKMLFSQFILSLAASAIESRATGPVSELQSNRSAAQGVIKLYKAIRRDDKTFKHSGVQAWQKLLRNKKLDAYLQQKLSRCTE